MPSISIDITTSNADFESLMLDAIKHELSSILQKCVQPIKDRLMTLCDHLIMGTPEYSSLINGVLLAELGIPGVKARVDEILNTIKNSLEVAYQPMIKKNGSLQGGLAISILQSDFADILNLPASSYVTRQGTQIPWLEWLLKEGNRIIVVGYDVFPAITPSQKRASRTGLAVMKKGMGWRIEPSNFSGTEQDNFLTRAFNIGAIEDLITDIVSDEIDKRM